MTDLIVYRWPYAGLALAAVLTVALLSGRNKRKIAPLADPEFVLPWLWPLYLVHQFEEHGMDFRLRPYAFQPTLCEALGYPDPANCPADAAFILAVNVIGCQLTFFLAWYFRRRRPIVAACAWGIALVNAFAHIGAAITHAEYNPGLVTAVFGFIPATVVMYRALLRAGQMTTRQIALVPLTGILLHAVLLLSLKLRANGMISESVFLVSNGLNGFWPLVIGLVGSRRAA